MKIQLFLVYLSEFLNDGYYVGLFILLPFIARELHLNLFQAGSLQAMMNILLVILSIPIVKLLIKYGTTKTLTIILLLFVICFSGISFIHSFPLLFFFFFILGIAFSLYSVTGSHVRLTWFDKKTRGKQIGNFAAIGDVAKAIFSAVCGLLIGIIGWRLTSFTLGVFILIFLGGFLFILNKIKKETVSEDTNEHLKHASFSYLLKQKQFLLALIAGFLDEGLSSPFYAFLPFLLLYKGVPTIFLGAFAGFYYGGNVLSRIIFGRLADKTGSAKILILLDIAMALVTFLLVISPSLFLTAIVAILLGLITEGTGPAASAMIAESLDHIENAHNASGIMMTTFGSARAVYPFIMGIIASTLGITWAFYILSFLCLLPLLPAFLFIKAKDTNTRFTLQS